MLSGMNHFESAYRLRKLIFKRFLRKNMTEAEEVLWEALRKRKLSNTKWRRQASIDVFITDFLCPEHRLVVEVDGGIHETQKDYDTLRSSVIADHGYRVIRFRNEEILETLPRVLRDISAAIRSDSFSAQVTPSPNVGEGAGG
jgi:very-short-patch-repair endonuclease